MADIAENDNATAAAAAATARRQSSWIRWTVTAGVLLIITSAVSIMMLNWGVFFPTLSYDPTHDRVVRSKYVTAKAGHILIKPTISRATYVRAEETGEAIPEFHAEDSTQGFLDRFGFFWGAPSTTSDSDTAHGETRQRQAFERTESKLAEYSAKQKSYEKAKQSRTAESESSKAWKYSARKTAYEEAKQSQVAKQEEREAPKAKIAQTTLAEKDRMKLSKYAAETMAYERAKQSQTAERESSKASKYSARKTAYEEAKQSQSAEHEKREASKIKNSDSQTTPLSEKDKSKEAKYSAKTESYEKAKQSQTAEGESSKASKYSARKTAYEEARQSQSAEYEKRKVSAEQEKREASKIKNSDSETTPLFEKDKSKMAKYSAKIESHEKAKQSQTAEGESSKASKYSARKTAYEEAKQSQSAEHEKREASKIKNSDSESETTLLSEKDKSKMAKYSAKIESSEKAKQSQTAERKSSKASKSAARKTAYEDAKQSQVAKPEEREASSKANIAQTTLAEKDKVKLSKYAAKMMAYERSKQSHAAQQGEKEASKIRNAETILTEKDQMKASRDSARRTADEKAKQSQIVEQAEREASKIKNGGTTLAEKDRVKASKYAAKITAHEEARQGQAAEQENRKASRIKDREAAQAEKEKVKGLRMEPGEEMSDTSPSSATSSRSHKDKDSSALKSTGILGWGSSVAQKALDRITLKKDDDEWRTEAEGDEREAGTRVATHPTSGKLTPGIPEIKPSSSSPAPRSRTPVELPPKSPGKSGSEPSTSTTDAPQDETEERIRPLESAGAETRSRETLQGWAGFWNRARREHGPTDTPSIEKYASSSVLNSEHREETSSSESGKITKEDKTSVDGKKDTEPKPAASGPAGDGSETGAQKPSRGNNPSQPSESSEPSSLWSQVKSAPSDFMAWWAEALRVPDKMKDEVIRQKQAAETTGKRILKEASAKTEERVPSSEKQSPENPRTSPGSSKVVWKDRSFWEKSSRQGAAYNEDSLAEESDFPSQEETSFESPSRARSRGQGESTDAVSEHPKQEESSKHDPASEDRETEWASPSSQYEAADTGTSETQNTKEKQAANEAVDKEPYESLTTSWWGSQMMPAWLKRSLPTSAPRKTSSASSKLEAVPSKDRRWEPGFFSFPGERAMTIQEQRVARALGLTLTLYSVIDQLMAEGNSHHVNITRLQKAWDGVSSSSKVLDSSQLINEMARESDGRDRLQTYPGVVHRFSHLAKSLAEVSIQIVNGEITEEMASSWLNESTRDSIEAFVQEIKKRPRFALDDELVSEGFHWQILTDCEEMLRFTRDALSKNFAPAEI